jgi:hypothetical protein
VTWKTKHNCKKTNFAENVWELNPFLRLTRDLIMDDESIYERIQDIFGHFPENLNILEEQIDVGLQTEYFEFSRNFRENNLPDTVPAITGSLNDSRTSIQSKKELLVQLAIIEEVEAYRAIESYLRNPDAELRNWAILAFQESRMLLQSKFLDENQVFISTGLGGKGSKLRYFVVLISSFDTSFTGFQQKLVRAEFEFSLKKFDAELETTDFIENFCSLMVMVPIHVPIRNVFKSAIAECNQYGGFIRPDFIVTNVKKLSTPEIREFIRKQKGKGENPDED